MEDTTKYNGPRWITQGTCPRLVDPEATEFALRAIVEAKRREHEAEAALDHDRFLESWEADYLFSEPEPS